jgi:hypothetical protein
VDDGASPWAPLKRWSTNEVVVLRQGHVDNDRHECANMRGGHVMIHGGVAGSPSRVGKTDRMG